MPTYQSTPLYPILFPDMAVRSNQYGFQPLKGNTLVHAELNRPEHPQFKEYADSRVLAGLYTNKVKDSQMLQGPPSIKGNVAFTTYRGPQGHAMSGGTVWTRDAEKTIQSLLRDRKFQLDAIDQANFDTVSPERVKEQEPESETFALDKLFSDLYSSVDEGVIDRGTLRIVDGIMNFFLMKADMIPDHKFAEYKEILGTVLTMFTNILTSGEQIMDQRSDGPLLRKLENDVLLLSKYITEFQSYLGEPSKKKAARLGAIRGKLLASRGKFIPEEQPEEERQTYGMSDEQMGQYGLTPEVRAQYGFGRRRR